jgi:hypothetical protein
VGELAGVKLHTIPSKVISLNNFIDKETNSTWNFAGYCIDGKYKGKKLEPIAYGLDFAFAWLAFHPESIVYTK